MHSVFSCNRKINFDIHLLEELGQKNLIVCLGFGFENMSNVSLRLTVERRVRKISKTQFLKLWQIETWREPSTKLY